MVLTLASSVLTNHESRERSDARALNCAQRSRQGVHQAVERRDETSTPDNHGDVLPLDNAPPACTNIPYRASTQSPVMDWNNLKDTVSNMTLYDVKAGVRKVQNGRDLSCRFPSG